MWKKINVILVSCFMIFGLNMSAYSEDIQETDIVDVVEQEIENPEVDDIDVADEISSSALDNYDPKGSLFEKITTLEQEKIVVQLEKERAQLDLELERLNAERIKLQMELETLSGRAEQQQQELEAAKTQLEIQAEQLKRQRDELDRKEVVQEVEVVVEKPKPKPEENITKKYKLINVIGVDNQLQATIEEIATGQKKYAKVGKELDGYMIKSISLNEGVVFEKDGETESLNIGK